ncbi:MAG: TIGR00282 family metallophosphoesterase [Sphaerochaetaceae bacterium]|jgi:metallophosphoesterase (TIGR00282 family)|nr:TIGR00282 family metallophosphoesterase [Sphaerochaetaceae bacterium]
MKIIMLGEIVGRAGIQGIKEIFLPYKQKAKPDLVIANAEGTTNGYGLGSQHAMQLFKYGLDVLTGGEKIFFKPDMQEFVTHKDRVLRPANLPEAAPGKGVKYIDAAGKRVMICNLIGLSDFSQTHANNPYSLAKNLMEKSQDCAVKIISYHASTTAEKLTMGFMLDGQATIVAGTHCKALSADARILEKGTAYITDLGLCGAFDSVGGFDPAPEIEKYIKALPIRSQESFSDIRIQGIEVDTDDDGEPISIATLNLRKEDV